MGLLQGLATQDLPPPSLILSPSLPLLPLLIRGLIRGKRMKRLALLRGGGKGTEEGRKGYLSVQGSLSLIFSSLLPFY
jgi:hypothetical protein